MITLKQISDLFISDISGGKVSKDSTVSPQEVIKKIRSFLHTVLKPVIWDKIAYGDRTAITQAIYSYELSLLEDAQGKYLDIPDLYMALHDNRGFHRLYVKGNPFADFVLMHNPGISGELPHASMKGVQYCYLEGQRVRIAKGSIAKKADKMILQILNQAPDAVDENTNIPILPEQLSEILRLLKMDYAPMAGIQTDYINNQNTNIR